MNNLTDLVELLSDISDVPRYEARLIMEKNLSPAQIDEIINARQKGEPLSKILGEKGFYKYIFKTSKDVLDPRADSETLVESVLKYFTDKNESIKILDIGTGSGCLLISSIMEYSNAVGIGIDKSAKALKIAQENADKIASDKTLSFIQKDFMLSDWCNELPQFDIIISNPPYIKTSEINTLDVEVKQYDPVLALDGGYDGLNAYRQLAQTLMKICHANTKVFFEIGQGQENDVINLMHANGFSLLDMEKDLNGIIRVLIFQPSRD